MKYNLYLLGVLPLASPPARGAWIEIYSGGALPLSPRSPPARGAWIEIAGWCRCLPPSSRRPPRGGRGLKYGGSTLPVGALWSPPARGAWIEIEERWWGWPEESVAPREGGVD